jgi:hypothetical protein
MPALSRASIKNNNKQTLGIMLYTLSPIDSQPIRINQLLIALISERVVVNVMTYGLIFQLRNPWRSLTTDI